MPELVVVLLPAILVAAGGLGLLACEPFLADRRKHVVLPWLGMGFLVAAALAQVLLRPDGVVAVGSLYVTDPVRAWLSLAVIGSAAAALAGLQQSLRRDGYPAGEPYALALLAAVGVQLMVAANHYLGLFVGLELASIAVYATVGTRRNRLDAGEGLLKYLVMGAVFSAVFLYGVALTYGATGALAYGADIQPNRDKLFMLGQTLIMLGLLFKVGAVPFHFWSPDAYTGAPIAITGFMAAVMKIGGFVALGAIWMHVIAAPDTSVALGLHQSVELDVERMEVVGALVKVLAGIAVLSLLVGNFSALNQSHLRRLMAFSSVSHAGYMLLAFTLPESMGSGFSLLGLWYYLIAYAVATAAALALIAGLAGPEDDDALEDLAGVGRRHPWAGALLTVLLASLAGLPPTAGFIGKYLIFSDLVGKGQVALAVLGMVIAVVGAVYYLRLVVDCWSGDGDQVVDRRVGGLAYACGGLAAALTLALLAWPDLGLAGTVVDAAAAAVAGR